MGFRRARRIQTTPPSFVRLRDITFFHCLHEMLFRGVATCICRPLQQLGHAPPFMYSSRPVPLTLLTTDPSDWPPLPKSGLALLGQRQNGLLPDQPCLSALRPACTAVAFPMAWGQWCGDSGQLPRVLNVGGIGGPALEQKWTCCRSRLHGQVLSFASVFPTFKLAAV